MLTNIDYGQYQELVETQIQSLLKALKGYLGKTQLYTVSLAIKVASYAHKDQYRKSGEPYITHPLEVATIIASWKLDEQTVCGALLHDVVEDTSVTKADLEQIFGPKIAQLVDSVTKLEKINFESEEIAHAEYFRKMVLAMAHDIRVILIKLADRVHNIMTLGVMRSEKKRRIALETMEIYVPIANRIGLHKVHSQLSDECFKHLHPDRYRVLSNAIKISNNSRMYIIDEILRQIENALHSNGIMAQIIYRNRSIYHIYKRMKRQEQSFKQSHDVFEIKILVNKIRECYLCLGVLHSLYQPIPGKFKDYIAIPKNNGYQSLHIGLIGPEGTPLRAQIRTIAMDDIAEHGIISHWVNNQSPGDDFSFVEQRTTNWINNILDIQANTFSAHEFLTNLKQDLSPPDIYVFTPKGKAILLPRGSRVIDFAYHIHSDLGDHCFGARVNQKIVKLDYLLHNGDIIDVRTKPEIEPMESWLTFAASGKAISRIQKYLKEQKFDENVTNGARLLSLALGLLKNCSINIPFVEISKCSDLSTVREQTIETLYNFNTDVQLFVQTCTKHYLRLLPEEVLRQIGLLEISALHFGYLMLFDTQLSSTLNIHLSMCSLQLDIDKSCMPLPNMLMLGYINRQGNLALHRSTCKIRKNIGVDKISFIHIINDVEYLFAGCIEMLIKNTPGIFAAITNIIGNHGVNILELNQELIDEQSANITATLNVTDLCALESILTDVQDLNHVINAKII